MLAAMAIAIAVAAIALSLSPLLNSVPTVITTTVTSTVTKAETTTVAQTFTVTKRITVTTARTTTTYLQTQTNVLVPLNATEHNLRVFSNYEGLAEYLRKAVELSSYGVIPLVGKIYVTVPTATLAILRLDSKAIAIPHSRTNVQVEGVDELDVAKTDGGRIYFATGNKVYIVDAEARKLLSVIELPKNVYARGVFIYDARLVVIVSTPVYRMLRVSSEIVPPPFVPPPSYVSNTTVLVYNVSDPMNPTMIGRFSVSGSYVSSRMVGPYLYVVLQLPSSYGSKPVLPLINGTVPPPDSIVAISEGSTVYTILSVINIENMKTRSYVVLADPASRIFMTPKSLYIVTSLGMRYAYREVLLKIAQLLPQDIRVEVIKQVKQGNETKALELIRKWLLSLKVSELKRVVDEMNKLLENLRFSTITRIYRFSVNGMKLILTGYSDVDGVVLDQFSMGEIDGGNYFVIATTSREIIYYVYVSFYMPSTIEKEQEIKILVQDTSGKIKTVTVTIPPIEYPTRSRIFVSIYPKFRTTSNNVFVIDARNMNIVGELRGLAQGERIYAARIIGNMLFLVTFRRVDPLFAIDLSNPAKPEVIGYVKIPGYSEYLHPVAPGILLGIGIDRFMGKPILKISLFNVTDPKNMEEIAKIEMPYGYTSALYDHHAVTIDLDRELLFIPIAYRWRTIGIAEITFANKSLDLVGIAMHSNALRALYIGNELFTISPYSIKVYDIATLKLLGSIDLESR